MAVEDIILLIRVHKEPLGSPVLGFDLVEPAAQTRKLVRPSLHALAQEPFKPSHSAASSLSSWVLRTPDLSRHSCDLRFLSQKIAAVTSGETFARKGAKTGRSEARTSELQSLMRI